MCHHFSQAEQTPFIGRMHSFRTYKGGGGGLGGLRDHPLLLIDGPPFALTKLTFLLSLQLVDSNDDDSNDDDSYSLT